MSFDWWTFALQTVNFAVLVWLLHRFLYQPVLRMVDARRAEIDHCRLEAVAAAEQAKQHTEAIAAERASIEQERTAALNQAAARANEAAAQIRAQAEREAAEIIAEARKSIAAERSEALAGARSEAVDLGLDVARRLLVQAPVELRAEAWLDRVEHELGGLSPAGRLEVCSGLDAGELRIITPVMLDAQAQQLWRERLNRVLDAELRIRFEVDESLLAGVELHFPRAILRLSWRSALAAIRSELEHDAHAH